MNRRDLYEALEYLRERLGDGEINFLLNRMADDPRYAHLGGTINRLHAIHLTEARRSERSIELNLKPSKGDYR
jgi:hypothetical protein